MASATQTDSRPADTPQPSRRTRLWLFVRHQLWSFLELFALTGFVVAQPLLDVIGRSPDFLLFRQADARDIALLAVTITLLPPLVLWGLEAVAGLAGRRVQRLFHLTLVAGLLGLLGLEVAKKTTPLRGSALVVVGVLVGLGAGALYAKGSAFRLWLRYASPAPLVFLLVSGRHQPAPPSRPARRRAPTRHRSSSSCWTSFRRGRSSTIGAASTGACTRTSPGWPPVRPGTATPPGWPA